MDHVSRLREARRKLRIRQSVAHVLDTALTWAAHRTKMCGEGAKHNWSILFAQLWFTDCPCCLFYRGVAFGCFLGASAAGCVVGGLLLTGVL